MHARRSLSILLALSSISSFAAVLLSPGEAAAQTPPPHLLWAERLIDNVLPENNTYGTSPHYIYWAGEHDATEYKNRTQCNSFLTRLLQQAYDWTDADIRLWMGSGSPSAAMYHAAIVTEERFDALAAITDVLPGDVIAIKYPAGSAVSGHIAIVVDAPALRAATAPLVSLTVQYEVTVVDSSSSGHGPTDTRLNTDGTWHPGAGIGVMRLYANADGGVVGHTWSTSSGSVFHNQVTRNVVLGRLQ